MTGKCINPEVVAFAVDEDGLGYLANGQGPQRTRGPAQKGEGAGPISFWEAQDSLLILVVDTVNPGRGLADGALQLVLVHPPSSGNPLASVGYDIGYGRSDTIALVREPPLDDMPGVGGRVGLGVVGRDLLLGEPLARHEGGLSDGLTDDKEPHLRRQRESSQTKSRHRRRDGCILVAFV